MQKAFHNFNIIFLLILISGLYSCKTDDIDPAVELSLESATLNEEDGPVVLTATLNSEVSQNVVITLELKGTAVLDADYSISATEILIQEGQTTGNVTFTDIPDGPTIGTKTIEIGIKSTQGAIVPNKDKLVLTILDFSSGFNYVAENFDYAAGSKLTDNNWYAHSAAGNNSILMSNNGLNWTGYVGSGIGNAALVNNTGEDVNKPFPANIDFGEAFTSFLIEVNNPSFPGGEGFFFHYAFYSDGVANSDFSNITTAFRGRTHLAQGSSSNQFKIGLSFNSGDPTEVTNDLNIGETYLVVVKYKFIEGENNDEVSLYLFEEGADISSEPSTPTLGPFTRSGSAGDAPYIQAVALRQYNENQDITVDGIYVRNEWNLVDSW